MLIGHDVFMDELYSERMVWIEGSTRSYKTGLAYRLAHEIMQSKRDYRYIISNVPDVWSTPLERIEMRGEKKFFMDSVIIADEAGEFITNENEFRAMSSFMGKMNNVCLFPSHKEPYGGKLLHVVVLFNALIVGIPAIIYGWNYKRGSRIKDKGSFIWSGMSEIYGVYDSHEPVTDDAGILDFLMDVRDKTTKRTERKRYYGGKTYGVLKLDTVEFGQAETLDNQEKEPISETVQRSDERKEVLMVGGVNFGDSADNDLWLDENDELESETSNDTITDSI